MHRHPRAGGRSRGARTRPRPWPSRERTGRSASRCSTGDPPKPGDWVVIQLGFALERLTDDEAAEAIRLLDVLMGSTADDCSRTTPRRSSRREATEMPDTPSATGPRGRRSIELPPASQAGILRFIHYGFMPNRLGYCGPDDNRRLFDHGVAGQADASLIPSLARFLGPLPYLRAIAAGADLADPFDDRVVEAYWIGNDLLERFASKELYAALRERFRSQLPPKIMDLVADKIPAGALPHHSFHVFDVWLRVGRLDGNVLRHARQLPRQLGTGRLGRRHDGRRRPAAARPARRQARPRRRAAGLRHPTRRRARLRHRARPGRSRVAPLGLGLRAADGAPGPRPRALHAPPHPAGEPDDLIRRLRGAAPSRGASASAHAGSGSAGRRATSSATHSARRSRCSA